MQEWRNNIFKENLLNFIKKKNYSIIENIPDDKLKLTIDKEVMKLNIHGINNKWCILAAIDIRIRYAKTNSIDRINSIIYDEMINQDDRIFFLLDLLEKSNVHSLTQEESIKIIEDLFGDGKIG